MSLPPINSLPLQFCLNFSKNSAETFFLELEKSQEVLNNSYLIENPKNQMTLLITPNKTYQVKQTDYSNLYFQCKQTDLISQKQQFLSLVQIMPDFLPLYKQLKQGPVYQDKTMSLQEFQAFMQKIGAVQKESLWYLPKEEEDPFFYSGISYLWDDFINLAGYEALKCPGIVINDENAYSEKIKTDKISVRWQDPFEMPYEFKERVKYLFSLKKRWFYEEIKALTIDLLVLQNTFDENIMKITRIITERIPKYNRPLFEKVFDQFKNEFKEDTLQQGTLLVKLYINKF